MDNTSIGACNAVEHIDARGRTQPRYRFFTVVDGRNREFQRELDRLGLTRIRECFSVKDRRTNCFLRHYKVRSRDGDAFRQATENLAEHMPELGYPDYEDYALKALVEYDVISAKEAREQTGKPCEEQESPDYYPDALFNVFSQRTDLPKSLFWRDVAFIDGCEKEGMRLLAQRGLDDVKVNYAFAHKDWPRYVLIMCSVPKKRLDEFVDVMHELENRMLILGYRDYEEACSTLFRLAREVENEGA